MLLRLTLLVSILVHMPQNLFAAEDLIFQSGFEQTDMLTAPTGLNAITVSTTRIDLSWTDTTSTETGFGIEHSTDGSNWSPEDTVSANVSAYTDTNLSPATTHYYRVRAFDAVTSSNWSNADSATTDEEPLPDPPAAPSSLMATAIDPYSIELNWTDNATTETGFTIEHSTNGNTWSVESSLGPNTTTYTDAALSPATTHYYRVRAFDAITSSTWSNTASATTDEEPPPSYVPDALVAIAIDSNNIELSWVDNSNNETGFKIRRRVTLTGYITVGYVAANTTSFVSTNLRSETKYIYQVFAYNADGDSVGSNIASATTPP